MLPLDGDGFPPLHFSVLSEALGTFQPFSLSAAPLFAGKRRETFLLKKLT